MCVFVCMSKTHAHSDCWKAMHACVKVCVWACTRRMLVVMIAARRCMYVYECTSKAHAHGDCCEAMHVFACLCVLMHRAFGHFDCFEAMHACVGGQHSLGVP